MGNMVETAFLEVLTINGFILRWFVSIPMFLHPLTGALSLSNGHLAVNATIGVFSVDIHASNLPPLHPVGAIPLAHAPLAEEPLRWTFSVANLLSRRLQPSRTSDLIGDMRLTSDFDNTVDVPFLFGGLRTRVGTGRPWTGEPLTAALFVAGTRPGGLRFVGVTTIAMVETGG
jgi:hypothetical protein